MSSKKLTLVNLQCRSHYLTLFLMLDLVNGKPVITQRHIAEIFLLYCGFYPQVGETQTVS